MWRLALLLTFAACALAVAQSLEVTGHVVDPQGKPIASASVRLLRGREDLAQTKTNGEGEFKFDGLISGIYRIRAEAPAFVSVAQSLTVADTHELDLQFRELAAQYQSVVITAKTLEPDVDLRNSEVFNRTLFTRDDQVPQQLNAGINAGQHEGGGKSLEIRRFGLNLDDGGVNGGLKVLVDDVDQNQGTQGHGQRYLGSLKALSPELIQDVTIIDGPFSPEYGDFSGLGVVHIRQRDRFQISSPPGCRAATSMQDGDSWHGVRQCPRSIHTSPTKAPIRTGRFRIPVATGATM